MKTISNLADHDVILIDTCSLMQCEYFRKMMESQKDALLRAEKRIRIPRGVLNELNYLAEEPTSSRGRYARYALYLVTQYCREGRMEEDPDPQSHIRPDNYFLAFAAANREEQKIAILTQDTRLGLALENMNRDGIARRAKPLTAGKLAFDGTILPFHPAHTVYAPRAVDHSNAGELLTRLLQA